MLKDTPRSRMWESCLSGSERGLGTTMARLLESLSYSKISRIKSSGSVMGRILIVLICNCLPNLRGNWRKLG